MYCNSFQWLIKKAFNFLFVHVNLLRFDNVFMIVRKRSMSDSVSFLTWPRDLVKGGIYRQDFLEA
jgi:hypothetical protein